MMILPLLKSDLYRLVHSTYFWVVSVLSVLVSEGFTLIGILAGDDEPTPGAGRVWQTHAQMLSSSLLVGGLLLLFTVILTVRIASEDMERGFVKNLFAGRSRRAGYYIEKLVMIAGVTAWILFLNVVVTEVMLAVLGYRYAQPEPWGRTILYVALVLLGMFAMGALVAAMTWLIRSKAFSMTAGVLVAIGIVNSAVSLLAAVLVSATKMQWLGTLAQMTITSPLEQLGRQPDNLFVTLGAQNTTVLPDLSGTAPTWGWPLWVFSLVLFTAWIVLAVAVTLLTNRRRDVC